MAASLRLEGFEITPKDIDLLKKVKAGEITSDDAGSEIFKKVKE